MEIIKDDKKQTILIGDGITYSNNAGSIVRQCSIFGCDTIFFCPLDEKRLKKIELNINNRPIKNIDESQNSQNAFHNYQLKNIYYDSNSNIRYTKNFKKTIKKFSINHQTYVNIFYDIPINKIIEEGLKKS